MVLVEIVHDELLVKLRTEESSTMFVDVFELWTLIAPELLYLSFTLGTDDQKCIRPTYTLEISHRKCFANLTSLRSVWA